MIFGLLFYGFMKVYLSYMQDSAKQVWYKYFEHIESLYPPSIGEMAEMWGLCYSAAQDYFHDLIAMGWINHTPYKTRDVSLTRRGRMMLDPKPVDVETFDTW